MPDTTTTGATITAEPLTAEAFAQETDQPLEWLIVRGDQREHRVLHLERHLQLAQAVLPLNGSCTAVVAAPDAPTVVVRATH